MGVLVLIASRVTQAILARSTRAAAFASQRDGGWSSLGQLVLPLSLLSGTVAGTWRWRAPADRIFVTPAILAFAFVYSRSCSDAAPAYASARQSPSSELAVLASIAAFARRTSSTSALAGTLQSTPGQLGSLISGCKRQLQGYTSVQLHLQLLMVGLATEWTSA